MTSAPTAPWWRRPLTPDEHHRIRRQLFLIPVYMWLVYAWWATLTHLPIASSDPSKARVRDFVHFYAQGVIANEHRASALYDIDRMAAVVSRVIPGAGDVKYPPVYGPQVSLFFAPLARLPYNAALYVWIGITIACFLACGWAALRLCPRLADRRGAVLVMLLGAPALHMTLGYSQASAIGLVAVTLAALAFQSGRLFLAGLAIGALAYKPPLGLAAAVVMLLAAEWRVVAGAVVSALGQLTVGCLYWGFSILGPYLASLRRLTEIADSMEPYKYQMHSWRPFFQLLGVPEPAALVACGAASVATLLVAVIAWRGARPLAVRFGVLLLATMLVDPHLYAYDLIMLTPGLLLLWDWSEGLDDGRGRWVVRGLLALCYLMPVVGPLSTLIRVQVTVLGMSLLSVAATWPALIASQCETDLIHSPHR